MSRFVGDNVRRDVGEARVLLIICLSKRDFSDRRVFALETIYVIWVVNAMVRDF